MWPVASGPRLCLIWCREAMAPPTCHGPTQNRPLPPAVFPPHRTVEPGVGAAQTTGGGFLPAAPQGPASPLPPNHFQPHLSCVPLLPAAPLCPPSGGRLPAAACPSDARPAVLPGRRSLRGPSRPAPHRALPRRTARPASLANGRSHTSLPVANLCSPGADGGPRSSRGRHLLAAGGGDFCRPWWARSASGMRAPPAARGGEAPPLGPETEAGWGQGAPRPRAPRLRVTLVPRATAPLFHRLYI